MIQKLDMARLLLRDAAEIDRLRTGARDTGFLVVANTALTARDVERTLAAYRDFFRRPLPVKRAVDMARTGSNRGWGAPRSERVDPAANPDYKEVFDCGFELPPGDPMAELPVYAPNLWPDVPGFRDTVQGYYSAACAIAMDLLRAIADAIGEDAGYFDDRFDRPMALLRGNYYPARPDWAGEKDFGIGAHTDYGCLTLLASDGVPGLEVQGRDGAWTPVEAAPGEFVINFGEMLEMWTGGQVRATPHRVRGTSDERISIPLFFNPNHDTNVAPLGSDRVILAGDHLARRFNETYLHLQKN
ncbi:probable oxidoreductase [Pseudooceanicola batsensis HTCC2597]|uniref:2-oxoglutarate-dependent ethylene/succinate-forming enzyme n=1 Tax=Pseudooceanicola batsensis (strain ATCC BAA-863 / DSM 15984 / KCTC 12145 / HTCC2597) TaxID=252305 RepID=A3U2R2_PSEBH|nr:2OG-Fe(II) oxygenase family protein [Pseudooceanicola batsensis]EAQ01442.1 probable oxidoreductase [Pseudooceanicola batsensis HTCC2597]